VIKLLRFILFPCSGGGGILAGERGGREGENILDTKNKLREEKEEVNVKAFSASMFHNLWMFGRKGEKKKLSLLFFFLIWSRQFREVADPPLGSVRRKLQFRPKQRLESNN